MTVVLQGYGETVVFYVYIGLCKNKSQRLVMKMLTQNLLFSGSMFYSKHLDAHSSQVFTLYL